MTVVDDAWVTGGEYVATPDGSAILTGDDEFLGLTSSDGQLDMTAATGYAAIPETAFLTNDTDALLTIGEDEFLVVTANSGVFQINRPGAVHFTIDATVWFSSFSIIGERYLVGMAATANTGWAFTQNTDQLRFIYSTDGVNILTTVAIPTISAVTPLNAPVKIRVDYNGVNIRCYTNGAMTGKTAHTERFYPSTAGLTLGARSDLLLGSKWQGKLDDVKIIKGEALTASDAGYVP
jgi:hypothetical protein